MSVLPLLQSLTSTMQQDPSSADSTADSTAFSNPNMRGEDGDLVPELTEGEVLCIELYEEIPRFDREVVVREKVQIKKVLTEAADVQP